MRRKIQERKPQALEAEETFSRVEQLRHRGFPKSQSQRPRLLAFRKKPDLRRLQGMLELHKLFVLGIFFLAQ